MTTPNADGRKILLSRVEPEIHDAVGRTARRLGQTTSEYIKNALVRAVTADADLVRASNSAHDATVERLAAEANRLIRLSAGYDARKKEA